jgi:hypothetical protein
MKLPGGIASDPHTDPERPTKTPRAFGLVIHAGTTVSHRVHRLARIATESACLSEIEHYCQQGDGKKLLEIDFRTSPCL